jgi:hypothetical protein
MVSATTASTAGRRRYKPTKSRNAQNGHQAQFSQARCSRCNSWMQHTFSCIGEGYIDMLRINRSIFSCLIIRKQPQNRVFIFLIMEITNKANNLTGAQRQIEIMTMPLISSNITGMNIKIDARGRINIDTPSFSQRANRMTTSARNLYPNLHYTPSI